MPNITVYLDDKAYVDFHKLNSEKQEEVRKNTQTYLKKQIEDNKEQKKDE